MVTGGRHEFPEEWGQSLFLTCSSLSSVQVGLAVVNNNLMAIGGFDVRPRLSFASEIDLCFR